MVTMRRSLRTGKSRGFTLIEMMVVMAVFALMLSLAAPSFSQMIKAQRVRTFSSDLFNDILFARSEAIKRNAPVVVTPKDTASAKDWAKGWDIKTDTLVGGVMTTITLKSREVQSGGVTAAGAGVNVLTFGAAGRLVGVNTTQAITVQHADLPATDQRCVAIDFSGRSSTKAGAC